MRDIENNKNDIMKLEVLRFSSQSESTLGILFNITNGREFLCFTLEDEFRTQKVYGETRIPAGTYEIELRTIGRFHERYLKKFPEMHIGMLWIRNVPNFSFVLIHIGNRDDDTAACLLVGDTCQQNITEEGFIGYSTLAYKRIYPPIANWIASKRKATITFVDFDSVKEIGNAFNFYRNL